MGGDVRLRRDGPRRRACPGVSAGRGVLASRAGPRVRIRPVPNDPCAGTPAPITFTFRFASGRLQIFDPPTGKKGFDGGYSLVDDVMTIRDATMANIEGTYRVAYRLDGDRVSFDLLGSAGKLTRSSSRRGSRPTSPASAERAHVERRSQPDPIAAGWSALRTNA